MSRAKSRKVKIIIHSREPKDFLKCFRDTEEVFRPKDLEIEIWEGDGLQNSPENLPPQTSLDADFEQEVVNEAKKRLDELDKLAEAEKNSKTRNKQKGNNGTKKRREILAKRLKIAKWLKRVAKEGYRITVKSFFDAVLDKMKSI